MKNAEAKNRGRWFYVVVGVIILLMVGLVYAWSVLSRSISAAHPEWTSARLSFTYTLIMIFLCVGSLIVGILSKRVKARTYILLAGILMFAGLMIASLTKTSIVPLYIGLGVMCGTASGLAYNTVLSSVCEWFPDRHGQISGILLMGFGMSSFIIGNVFAATTPTDGSNAWCGTFRVFAIVVVIVLVICCFFIKRPDEDFVPPQAAKKKEVMEPASDINAKTMVRKPVFWIFYLWIIFTSAAGLVLIAHASGMAVQTGAAVTNGQIATAVGMISIMNGVGRVVGGTVFDRKHFRFTMLMTMGCFVLATVLLLLALIMGSFVLIVFGFLIGGFSYGCTAATLPAVISDFFGKTYYSLNFSIGLTNLIVASFASTIAGRLYDTSQTYMTTIYLMFAVIAVGFVLFLFIRRPKPEGMEGQT